MKKLNIVLSLVTNENDYQIEQAASAMKVAERLGVTLQILHADNDSIVQSQQLLTIIQGRAEAQPDGIILEPAGGTALPQVARAAASAGIAWVVLNREADYMVDLRRNFEVPVFGVTSNHEEIGRIQGRQLSVLLPEGGSILHIQGPAESLAAKNRTVGMEETKPAGISVKVMKGQWTESSAHKSVSSWLRLSTSQQSQIDAVVAQNDVMAIGARKAFQDLPDETARDRWMRIPYVGCDGLPKTGQAWTRSGLLTATVVIPPNSGQALDMLVRALQTGITPAERTYTTPESFPAIDHLHPANTAERKSFSAKL
jgi:ABC-type sugar transport system substrate-binding protein